MSEFLQLVCSRLIPNNTASTSSQLGSTILRSSPRLMSIVGEGTIPVTRLSFNLPQLQEDIVSHYLAGKPIIRDISSLRTLFKFRHSKAPVIKRTVSE